MAADTHAPPASFGMCRYWQLLSDPEVRTVFVTGTGGGFDFVHSMTVLPELIRQGKRIVIGSYSFGNPSLIEGGEWVFEGSTGSSAHEAPMLVKRVDATCRPDPEYGPEVGLCRYLDEHYPIGPDGVAAFPRRPAPLDTGHPVDRPAAAAAAGGQTPLPREGAKRWSCYAYYARAFTVSGLREFYARVCNTHEVDAILCVDGGSDSLMRGDEAGLGDPIEDCVTITAVATLPYTGQADPSVCKTLPPPTAESSAAKVDVRSSAAPTLLRRPLLARILLSIGFGCDRFNDVSDGASLRALAEITAMRVDPSVDPLQRPQPRAPMAGGMLPGESGFLGAFALEPTNPLSLEYRAVVDHLQAAATFRSVIANSIVECSAGGYYGTERVPPSLQERVKPGQLFLWPLMAMHFAFDVGCVVRRSLLAPCIASCDTVRAMNQALARLRKERPVREWEHLP